MMPTSVPDNADPSSYSYITSASRVSSPIRVSSSLLVTSVSPSPSVVRAFPFPPVASVSPLPQLPVCLHCLQLLMLLHGKFLHKYKLLVSPCLLSPMLLYLLIPVKHHYRFLMIVRSQPLHTLVLVLCITVF